MLAFPLGIKNPIKITSLTVLTKITGVFRLLIMCVMGFQFFIQVSETLNFEIICFRLPNETTTTGRNFANILTLSIAF